MAFIGLGDKVAVVEEMEEILELRGDIEEVAIIKRVIGVNNSIQIL